MRCFSRVVVLSVLAFLLSTPMIKASAADPGLLTFTKTAPPAADAGSQITYQINLTNGSAELQNATVTDNLPPGTAFVSVTATPPAAWNCAAPPVGGSGTITCQRTGGVVAPNEEAQFTIVVRICAEVECTSVISNQAAFISITPPVSVLTNIVQTTVESRADLRITKTGPASAAAGADITYTLIASNLGPSTSIGTTVVEALPAGWTVVSASTTAGNCAGVGTGVLTCNLGVLGASAQCTSTAPETATITVVAHIPAISPPGPVNNTATVAGENCRPDPEPGNNTAVFQTNVITPTLGPGLVYPASSSTSDTKAGSVLFFNFYVSDPTDTASSNTRISLTNINPTDGVAIHLFFVDGVTCSVADRFVCLTPNQTTSFLTSDIDPGTSGYLIAIAVDRNTGCPVSFNYLIGQANIKLASSPRRQDDLTAESCAAEFGSPVPGCTPASITTTLNFNGAPNGYNPLPRVIALDNIASRADGNDTLLVINRIGGNMTTRGAPIGNIFGILYDDAERAHSFTFSSNQCQLRRSLTNAFPRTAPNFEQAIPAGQSGWMKFWTIDDGAILGAAFNRNDNKAISASAFEGGHNLHKLRLTSNATLTVPVFPPGC